MPSELDPNVPEHVQRVRDMSAEELEAEVEAIYELKAVEPDRELPENLNS